MAVEMLTDSPLATVQDAGRTGSARYGYRRCGACDAWSMRIANLLCGNDLSPGQDAVVEFTLTGGSLRFTEDAVFAVTGAACDLLLDGMPVPMYRSRTVRAGQVLKIGMAGAGLRMYLAVRGGIALPPVMGSRSTDTVCRLGGLEGRKLRKGDVLPTLPLNRKAANPSRSLPQEFPALPPHRVRLGGRESIPVLRIVPGPQDDLFSEESGRLFCRSVYTVSSESDRMGCRLTGTPVPILGGDIISDPIVEGSVQISSGGLPIVMMADHQTTGGYAKIGTVIRPDLSVLAQTRPGERVCFSFVTIEEAQIIVRRQAALLSALARRFRDEDT